jgi:hypothetical protein
MLVPVLLAMERWQHALLLTLSQASWHEFIFTMVTFNVCIDMQPAQALRQCSGLLPVPRVSPHLRRPHNVRLVKEK